MSTDRVQKNSLSEFMTAEKVTAITKNFPNFQPTFNVEDFQQIFENLPEGKDVDVLCQLHWHVATFLGFGKIYEYVAMEAVCTGTGYSTRYKTLEKLFNAEKADKKMKNYLANAVMYSTLKVANRESIKAFRKMDWMKYIVPYDEGRSAEKVTTQFTESKDETIIKDWRKVVASLSASLHKKYPEHSSDKIFAYLNLPMFSSRILCHMGSMISAAMFTSFTNAEDWEKARGIGQCCAGYESHSDMVSTLPAKANANETKAIKTVLIMFLWCSPWSQKQVAAKFK